MNRIAQNSSTVRRSGYSHLASVASLFGALAFAGACQSKSESVPESSKTASSTAAPTPPKPSPEAVEPAPPLQAPETLLELGERPYGVTLSLDGDAAYLLTSTAAYRIAPGSGAARMPLDLGMGPTFTKTSILFWSKGAVRAVSKQGSDPRTLVKVEHEPQRIVASADDRFAWLDRDDKTGKFTIQTSKRGKPHVLYSATGLVSTPVMLQDWVFFVEVGVDASWRIGGVSLDGGAPAFSKPHTGRAPGVLVAQGDLFYYDGPRRSVLRLSPDLLHEEPVVEHFICSPLAVSDRLLCAQPGGLFEITFDTHVPRLLGNSPRGPISALAATATAVVWVDDIGKSGEDKLAVRKLALSR
jgi:hypothetical protein